MAKQPVAPATVKDKRDKPTKAEKQAMVAKLRSMGMTVQQLAALIDADDATLDMATIGDRLRTWLRGRPKAGK